MSFNIIEASKSITGKYKRYLRTVFDIKDPEYREMFLRELDRSEPFSKGPYLDVVDSFVKGGSVAKLIEDGVLHKDFAYIDDIYSKTLYLHQERAVRKAAEGRNLVVSTGTGSGKTESFLLPIIDSLMREKEANGGHLTAGVRALIIYPMNALANDQVERLRRTLANYQDITFGCYTGQTEQKYEKALLQYQKLNGKDPQKNELISRAQMKETPPHILITNYAMLEYLMLRPADNVFFSGDKATHWRYIVLDEAHTYSGSTGIEVAFLLRRVMAELSNPHVQYILTSATLGDENSNEEVVQFATNLCNAPFTTDSIIRASRVSLKEMQQAETLDLGLEFYECVSELIENGYDDATAISKINDAFHLDLKGADLAECLFDLIIQDKTYWTVKNYLATPKSTADVSRYMGWTSTELSDFVAASSFATKDRTKLFDARYHLFIKATEGVFITLPPHKNLFLERRNFDYVGDDQYRVFETVSCSQCHALYILGNIDGNKLVQSSSNTESIKEAFLIGDTVNDDDDDDTLDIENLKTEQFELCPHCGFIRKKNMVHKTNCEHNSSEFITITKVKTSEITGRVTKCLSCESVNRLGILRGFFTGQEASTSVIGTALFEELPESERKVVVHAADDEGFEGFEEDDTPQVVETRKAKQFIAFSDSRQAAAYYATYFSETYDGILYGRIIYDLIKQLGNQTKLVPHFVKDLAGVLQEHQIAPFLEQTPDYEVEAWKAVLKELVDNRARNSLVGLGLISIGFVDTIKFKANSTYQLSADEIKDLCLSFVLGMLSDVAIYYGKPMTDSDKEFFTHNGTESTYLSNGANSKYVKSFLPRNESTNNKRLEFLNRILAAKGIDVPREKVVALMEALWRIFFVNAGLLKNVTAKGGAEGFRVDTDKLTLGNNRKWYICSHCKRPTTINIAGVCPSYMCDGALSEIDIDGMLHDNHYYRMYNDLAVQPLKVVEHTAQLSREEAYKYQNDFKNKRIDVLSCSTTFEMGVDVGELETVFMRNMPPTPANYTQRAGRAGRSTKSAAFALTFCNKSNHDFNFFKDPLSMIKGTITPPAFKVTNEKIGIRHVYSSALAFFWRDNSQYFRDAEVMMEDTQDGTCGYRAFKSYLEGHPAELKAYLLRFLSPELVSLFEVNSFGWVKWLFDAPNDKYPNFKRVFELYNGEISALVEDKNKAFADGESVDYITWRLRNYRSENIISFLSKNSILPKYGFPVDTVDLAISTKGAAGGLQLSRDLSMAISEYAPGCQVVANGKLITSRYIRKVPHEHWKMYDFVKCPRCQTLNLELHKLSDEETICNCKQCGEAFNPGAVKTFLIPDFGFIADKRIEKPTLIKPERTYRSEASLVNYNNEIPETTYSINGNSVSVATIDNGKMAMLTTDDFFVCQECGFALDGTETAVPFVRNKPHEHSTSYGTKCKCTNLDKFSLGYTFETDVICIRIDKSISQIEEAISVLHALVLASCSLLNIDNNEIAGCLQYYKNGYYSFVLYDTTPGGAGHVRRLNNEVMIRRLLAAAHSRAKNCTCGEPEGDTSCYSCLRTYQNQKYHDVIKRSYVIAYLNDYSSNLE